MKVVTTPKGSPRSSFDAASRCAKRRDLDVRIVPSDTKTFFAEFSDASFLKPFVGTHRIQRVPKGETKRHTSTITVAVLDCGQGAPKRKTTPGNPRSASDTFDLSALRDNQELREDDLEERFTRGTGNGGQHKNKTDSCVVLTHTPTGTQVRIDGRSQWNNRQEARVELARRLAKESDRTIQSSLNADRVGQIGTSDRAEKGFTYNEQRDEVVCHATGQKWRMGAFMKGRF